MFFQYIYVFFRRYIGSELSLELKLMDSAHLLICVFHIILLSFCKSLRIVLHIPFIIMNPIFIKDVITLLTMIMWS
jgi:hypothetical protein